MIVGIHSFKGGSGKTFVALNLGYLLSRERRVCVLELDLRAPALHTFFQGDRYINQLLSRREDVNDYLYQVRENLSVIMASPALKDIKTSLRREDVGGIKILRRLQEVISELKSIGFEHILIDNSPGLSYMSVNSMILSDLLLFVARQEKQEVEGLKTLFEISRNIEKPKYVVLNRCIGDAALPYEVAGRIPCSCDVTMENPFFVELHTDHEVSDALRQLAEFIAGF